MYSDFIWIGLGLPKQENWIMKYLDKIDVGFAIGEQFLYQLVLKESLVATENRLEWFAELCSSQE